LKQTMLLWLQMNLNWEIRVFGLGMSNGQIEGYVIDKKKQ
jgi:hypothetical protein